MSPTTKSPSCNPKSLTTNTTTLPIPESNSICQIPFYIIIPKCLFKPRMRIPKRPVSFCLSIFSPAEVIFSSSPPHLSSRVLGFHSGILASCLPSRSFYHSPNKREVICFKGGNQLHASYTMDGTSVDDNTVQVQSSTSNDGVQGPCIWSSPQGGRDIEIGKQIFCNRSLNMKNIVSVGFDMDYTLAQYKPETFESLAYEGTVRKLVYDLGYPPELLEWSFDWKYMVRGLVLDKRRGNILKMDRHKYVKVAYHGFREMSKEDKVATYGSTLTRDAFDEPDYALIDTLFSLAEAYLFAQLVDFKDNNPGKVPRGAE
ncbi:unnamed protein product [Ilex paraguariensis]|uniref:5'-nucleotidase n=1 Tax=Ilex paraguariensis TaxID=185542 RepID=A0ABC8U3M3_9AQUA